MPPEAFDIWGGWLHARTAQAWEAAKYKGSCGGPLLLAESKPREMPYYLCRTEEGGLVICTSWPRAKAAVHGKRGSWTKRYETREDVERALAEAAPAGTGLPSDSEEASERSRVYVDGSAILDEWSACAVFFGPGDARNAVRELPPPHTSPRAEMAAVLLCLERGDVVNADVMSDSSFVCQAFERGWPSTFAHGDLIDRIRPMATSRNLRVLKVPGHAGVPGNEFVDGMLREVRERRRMMT